jgi:modification methylase
VIDLRLGDCLEVMKTIPDNSVDLVITSPPYNLGANHHTGGKRHSPYYDNFSEIEYQETQINVLRELYRITKASGSLFYNHKNRIRDGLSITPYRWLLKTNWRLKQELVWFNGSQNFDKCRFYPMTERIYWLTLKAETKLFNAINHHDFFNKSEWKPEGTSKLHTRSFPEKMVSDILQCFPNSITIFDPYMGSGTVGKVAKEMGKDFIGIEISPEYFKIAERRINNTTENLL